MYNIKSSQTFSNENIILYEDNKINTLPKGLIDSILKTKINWEDIFYYMPLSDLRKLKITKVVERRLSHVKDLLLKEL